LLTKLLIHLFALIFFTSFYLPADCTIIYYQETIIGVVFLKCLKITANNFNYRLFEHRENN